MCEEHLRQKINKIPPTSPAARCTKPTRLLLGVATPFAKHRLGGGGGGTLC